jgi:hypothetical protein
LWLLLNALPLAFGMGNEKVGIIDVYIQTYNLNRRDTTGYVDEKGVSHVSGKEFYTVITVHGTPGGPVHYRFFLEHVCLSMQEDSVSKYSAAYPPIFISSRAEMIDSASVSRDIISRLPSTFTKSKIKG